MSDKNQEAKKPIAQMAAELEQAGYLAEARSRIKYFREAKEEYEKLFPGPEHRLLQPSPNQNRNSGR